MDKGISIIICCYNATGRIEPTLEHLQKQIISTNIQWEVVLVDNASTDNIAEHARTIWNRKPVADLQVLREETPGLMHARHKGLDAARYSIVSFIDDDNWVEAQWIEKVYGIFQKHDKVGACGSNNKAAFESAPPEWFQEYGKDFAVGSQAPSEGIIESPTGFLWGAGLSMRREIWLKLKALNYQYLTTDRKGKELSAGGDTELCYAIRLLGYRLYYQPDLTLVHFMPDARLQWQYLLRMFVGFGTASVRLKCYQVLLDPGSYRMKSWFREWLFAARSYYYYNSRLSAAFDVKEDKRNVQASYWKGVMQQLMKDRGKIGGYIDQLKRVFFSQNGSVGNFPHKNETSIPSTGKAE